MKRLMISTTALAAICAGVLMILPTAATAATPLETFKKMRGALSLAANRGELAVRVLAKPNGEVDVTGTLDGVKLPDSFPLKVVSKQDDDIVNVAISVDLDPTHFSSIKYGKTPNTLHMVYKEIPNSIIVVQLDPKSMLPTSWTTEELWAEVVPTTTFNRKEVEAPAKNLETMMHVRVRLRIGQEATVSINATEK